MWQPLSTVVIPRMQKLYPISENLIYQPIGFVDPPQPDISAKMFQVLRLADSREWIMKRGIDEIDHSQRCLPVGADPE